MTPYESFIFKRYEFNDRLKTLRLFYSYDDKLNFTETYKFDFSFAEYDKGALDQAIQLLFFMAGVSYYKAYVPSKIQVSSGHIDHELATFLSKTYQRGLGEFFYLNQLDPQTSINIPVTTSKLIELPPIQNLPGQIIGLGGGKDSLVSVELMRDQPLIATWSLNHRTQLEPLVNKIGLPHFWVEREWDHKLLELTQQGAYNGHIPISAIFACVSVIVSILTGYRDSVVSNESSASDPTLSYLGFDINHQYSKSLEFEQDFQDCIVRLFKGSLRYYSLLRPFSELRIAELFAKTGFDKYHDVFSSCNRAFTHDQNHMFWCGECPKCAFVFLIFTPFIRKELLEELWQGKNLLLDPKLEPTYKRLLGITGTKPLDCVGEVKESRAAMKLAKAIYPELNKYEFDLPSDYNYQAWSEQSMPHEVFELLQQKMAKF
ncbi:MAG TPA: hypothetical protein VLF79_02715 [Candidatus Saccharimonadales bacterium]|nr:hypothetical protein [Candidatus Saccharimonadales bacterium]